MSNKPAANPISARKTAPKTNPKEVGDATSRPCGTETEGVRDKTKQNRAIKAAPIGTKPNSIRPRDSFPASNDPSAKPADRVTRRHMAQS